jgi:hypothetical protein
MAVIHIRQFATKRVKVAIPHKKCLKMTNMIYANIV